MFNMTQFARQYFEQKQRERLNSDQQPENLLIPSAQSSTEVAPTFEPAVQILQPNEPNNEVARNVPLGNVTQSYEGGNTVQESTPGIGDNINITAALLTLVLYMCSISLVVYGAIHLKDCPAENMITITYIAMGCLMLLSRVLSSPEECRNIFKKESNPQFLPTALCRMCLNLLVQLVTMCFFFALCYWAFHINPDFTEGSSNYCAKELYKNTYYGCIVALAILGIGFTLICCGVCCAIFCSTKQ